MDMEFLYLNVKFYQNYMKNYMILILMKKIVVFIHSNVLIKNVN